MAKFQVGDVVRLKSGGPGMAVRRVHGDVDDRLTVEWFDGSKRCEGQFLAAQVFIFTGDNPGVDLGTRPVIGDDTLKRAKDYLEERPDPRKDSPFAPGTLAAKRAEMRDHMVAVPASYGITADELIAGLAKDLHRHAHLKDWAEQTAWIIAHVAAAVADHVASGTKPA